MGQVQQIKCRSCGKGMLVLGGHPMLCRECMKAGRTVAKAAKPKPVKQWPQAQRKEPQPVLVKKAQAKVEVIEVPARKPMELSPATKARLKQLEQAQAKPKPKPKR